MALITTTNTATCPTSACCRTRDMVKVGCQTSEVSEDFGSCSGLNPTRSKEAMKTFFVIPHLGYSGAARQLTLLASNLPRDRFESCVCVLGRDGPWNQPLRDAGVEVEALGWTRLLDARPILRLRQLVHDFQPD